MFISQEPEKLIVQLTAQKHEVGGGEEYAQRQTATETDTERHRESRAEIPKINATTLSSFASTKCTSSLVHKANHVRDFEVVSTDLQITD